MTNKQYYMPWLLICGLVGGILSGLPFINLGNCLLCAWIWAPAMLATYMVIQRAGGFIETSEGALIGLLTGLIAAPFWTLTNFGVQMMMGGAALASMPGGDRLAGVMGAGMLIAFVIIAVLCCVFGALGGLIGALIFNQSQPPGGGGYGGPPQGGYGGPPQGGFGGPPQGGGFGGPPQGGQGGFGGPPQGGQGGGFGGPPQGGQGGGFGGPPQGGQGGGFGGPPQGGGFGGPPQGGQGGGFGGPQGGQGGGFGPPT